MAWQLGNLAAPHASWGCVRCTLCTASFCGPDALLRWWPLLLGCSPFCRALEPASAVVHWRCMYVLRTLALWTDRHTYTYEAFLVRSVYFVKTCLAKARTEAVNKIHTHTGPAWILREAVSEPPACTTTTSICTRDLHARQMPMPAALATTKALPRNSVPTQNARHTGAKAG